MTPTTVIRCCEYKLYRSYQIPDYELFSRKQVKIRKHVYMCIYLYMYIFISLIIHLTIY